MGIMRVLKSSFLFAAAVSLSGCIVVPYEVTEGRVAGRLRSLRSTSEWDV